MRLLGIPSLLMFLGCASPETASAPVDEGASTADVSEWVEVLEGVEVLEVVEVPDVAVGSDSVDVEDVVDEPVDSSDDPPDAPTDARDATDVAELADTGPVPDDVPVGMPDTGPPLTPCEASEVDGRLIHGDASPLVLVDPGCGRLSYGLYANQGQSQAVNILPDFSYAGYRGGGIAIPDVPTAVTVLPGEGDDRAAIQEAIDAVSALPLDGDGFRGAVFLTAGTYQVGDTLTIAVGGVILRGAGQGTDGTVLVATKTAQHDLIHVKGSGSKLGEIGGTRVSITSSYVAVGSRTFEVESAAGFAVGDSIGVARTPNQAWIDALAMGQWGWTAGSYAIDHERVVTAIAGNAITVDVPIVDTIETQYGGGAVFLADLTGRIRQCGIEDLRLESEYGADEDEDHGWNAIKFSRVADSWVRRVTAVHFGYSAVTLHAESAYNTIEEVAQLDPISKVSGGRRYSFNVSGGIGNLFLRCFARDGRHNFVTGSRVTGPNVWLDCLSTKNNSDEGPHHRWATGLLFDNTMSQTFDVQNRTSSGTGHGWAGAQTLFWNIMATHQIRCDAPIGGMSWVVGSIGAKTESSYSPQEPFGWWELEGGPVVPRSLYLAQLEDRLGADAVAAIAIEQQLEGTIWNLLNGWAGKSALADAIPSQPVVCDGIPSGTACCAASCGVCGGPGCSALPGGASSCCTSKIKEAGKSCADNPPPCVIP